MPGTTVDVQAILNDHCIGCHGATGPSAGMSLTDVRTIVGTTSGECTQRLRIAAGHPENSYLVDKIMGAAQQTGGCFMGLRMPRGGAPALASTDIATITSWITTLP